MYENHKWQPQLAIETFFFDCDSTLSLVEGIDVLASMNDIEEEVKKITRRCMEQTGLNTNDYKTRLDLAKPTKQQVKCLGKIYYENITPGAKEVIKILKSFKKKIFILSGGIQQALQIFAKKIGVDGSNVYGVEIYFDRYGRYSGFRKNPLADKNGKRTMIQLLTKPDEKTLLIGDGMSDFEAASYVTRFVGFSGSKQNSFLRKHAEFCINHNSLFPLLPLSLTSFEAKKLTSKDRLYYEKGLADIENFIIE
ncbi:HAD-IB family phosphatase [Legionella hackeliae]|uniref:phosphoserine phosphatase n=1 Tax=Legionella hackeliae TaxID=449 RepID=A0A0A8UVV7_LEGHA|nr:HAD-IB family phosphatase [Legionella hackeliae]KTD10076.1 phosphoserine phosphatase [Legionella hackeliae]CEK11616.1 putative phosphoserine phosphatase [Legionella hackeliae]STX48388.1 phosphoserine phosphatase [Legionella hackeliae]